MVHIVYKTDNQHSYASRDMIGITPLTTSPIDLIQEHARKEGEMLSGDDIINLHSLRKTQGYKGEGEYDWETVELNTLL